MWYSVIASQLNAFLGQSDTSSAPASDTSTLAEPFAAVARIRERVQGDSDEDEETYRRILIIENKRKRIIMIDPNPCYLKDGAASLNESSLIDMSRAGRTLFKTLDRENLEDCSAMGSQQKPSWIESIIQRITKLGMGVASDMV